MGVAWLPRSIAARSLLIILILGIGSVAFFFQHFESHVNRLEHGERNLELAVAQMQHSDLQHNRIISTSQSSPEKELVVIYNRVPKTGSTSFVGVAYDLCRSNGFHVLHVNVSANMHVLTLPNQARFVQNVSHWNSVKPAFYHGHMAYVDFNRFGSSIQPIYINLIRRPLDRLVSYYYFLRHGDDFRPHLVRRKHGDKMTFDECVEQKQADCDPDNMWLQIPFFCGHAPACWEAGNPWALEQAKKNLLQHYMLVGVTEQLAEFVNLLELTLPSMFQGATQHFASSSRSHLRRTAQKIKPSPSTVRVIEQSQVWKMENEFYDFALAQFRFVLRKVQAPGLQGAQQTFFYEKIRPK